MSGYETSDRFLLVDIETTGLAYEKDLPIEIGFMLCDLQLRILEQHAWLIWSPEHEAIFKDLTSRMREGDKVAEIVYQMHKKSGLWVDARANGQPLDVIEERILAWMRDRDIPEGEPLVGNSVNFDRFFIYFNLKRLYDKIHYRLLDVSTFKVAAQKLDKDFAAYVKASAAKVERHRVYDDLLDTRAELGGYIEPMFGVEVEL